MGSSSSKSAVTASTPWYVDFDKSMRGLMGSPDGALFITGFDLLTLPFAFLAGSWIGVGIGLWRGQEDLMRPIRGMGTLMVGLTLAVPAYVRIGYMPFLFISPTAFAWSFFTGGVIGAGMRMLRPRATTNRNLLPGGNAGDGALARQPEERDEDSDFVDLAIGSFAAGIIASGLYLALPGPVRVLMMYS